MQTRRMIFALFASITVFYLALLIMARFAPRTPPPATQPATSQPADRPAATVTQPAATQAEAWEQTQPETRPETSQNVIVRGGSDSAPKRIGNTDEGNPFPMAIDLLPRGASVTTAAIRDHWQTVDRQAPYTVMSPMLVPDASRRVHTFHSFVTPRLRLQNLEIDVDLENVLWSVEHHAADQAVFAVRIEAPDGQPLARVVKTYTLAEQPAKGDANTYDLSLALSVENLSDGPLEAILVQQGPVGFHKEEPRTEDRRIIGAVWQQGHLLSKGHYRKEVAKKHVLALAADSDEQQERIAWAAVTNKFFTCIMAPAGRLGPQDQPRFARVEALPLVEEATDHEEDMTFRYISTPLLLPAHGDTAEVAFDCYIGPKSKVAFERVEAYSRRQYYDVIRESFAWCTADALVGLMMFLLNAFYKVPPHNYGIAIIVLVLLVRGILHPLTRKSQINMMKMQKQQAELQPKLQVVREKYANDRTKLNQMTMEVYREAGINPASNIFSCLPMMLQLPIWVALWTALASTIEMRHAPFDGWWIRDLAGPDAVIAFSEPVNIPIIGFLMGGPLHSLNLLPVLLGISQLLQAKYMPHMRSASNAPRKPDAPQDQMEQQRKMMMFMSIIFVFFLYNAPSGLNLYIMSSNIFGIIEQWRIRRHIADLEVRRETEERLYGPRPPKPRKKGWLHKKWETLAKEAEEARKIQSERKKPGKTKR